MKVVKFSDLIGKKVVAFRGIPFKKNYSKEQVTELQYMLFDDGETFIEFREQDYYDYHDCSQSARNLYLQRDKVMWDRLMNNKEFREPDNLGNCPF